MADLREVFEMVKQQTEPDVDSWSEQERVIRRRERNRKIGAYAMVAALAIGALVFVLNSRNDDRGAIPASEQEAVDPAPVGGFALYDLATGETTSTGIIPAGSAVDVSPDGTKMVYADDADAGSGSVRIHIANVDGSNEQAFDGTGAGDAMAPRWSPDGTKVVYQEKTQEGLDIGNLYVLDVTTGKVEQITDLEPIDADVYYMAPTFSPDGQTVFFNRPRGERTGGNDTGLRWDLWAVPASGGEPTLIRRNAFGVDVSPTGDAMAYSEALNVDGEFTFGDLYVARSDGARKVADGPAEMPRWSPDGSQIAYSGDGTYILDVDPVETQHYHDVHGWAEWADGDTLMIELGG